MEVTQTPGPSKLFCIDCKHHLEIQTEVSGFSYVHVCSVEGKIDLVDGKPVYRRCDVMRSTKHACGPDGKLFEKEED